ncbi:hypothetical protein [Promicromonospora soli]
MFAGLMVLTAGVTMAAAPASATDCSTWINHDEINNAPDLHRAGASARRSAASTRCALN